MSDSKESKNRIIHKIIVGLFIIGNSLLLLSLFLISEIINANQNIFTIGAYSFFSGIVCIVISLLIIMGVSLNIL